MQEQFLLEQERLAKHMENRKANEARKEEKVREREHGLRNMLRLAGYLGRKGIFWAIMLVRAREMIRGRGVEVIRIIRIIRITSFIRVIRVMRVISVLGVTRVISRGAVHTNPTTNICSHPSLPPTPLPHPL